MLGAFELIESLYADEQITERSGRAKEWVWHEHDHRLFRGTERFFRPGNKAHLVAEWIPAVDGVARSSNEAPGWRTLAAGTARQRS